MPTPASTYQTLLTQLQNTTVAQPTNLAVQGECDDVHSIVEPALNKDSNYNKPVIEGDYAEATPLGRCADVIGVIAGYLKGSAYSSTSRIHRNADATIKQKITKQLLLAVAYGMESKEANLSFDASHAGNLFKSHLYAKDLLEKSPEFLLERAHVTDWSRRTFEGRTTKDHPEGEGITAFQYAVWAKDFKMIEMMIKCLNEAKISEEEHEYIRVELLRQYEQVTFPRGQGGGLIYTYTYERPNLNAKGFPQRDASGNWDCETVRVERDENHFDLTPLIEAYDYERNVRKRSWSKRDAYWIKVIGTMQRLLPVHVLQRYCDPNTQFSPLEKDKTFNGAFTRTMEFFNCVIANESGTFIFNSSLSSDFTLVRGRNVFCDSVGEGGPGTGSTVDLAAIRLLDKVCTNETKNIIEQLLQPRHSAELRP